MTRISPIALVALFALLSLLSACVQQGPPPYAERYVEALARYPGAQPVSEARLDAFVRFFSHAADPGEPVTAIELYAPQLYFSDTLLTSERYDAVLTHLDRMRQAAGELTVTVLDRQIDGADVYLVWRMHARFTPVRKPVVSDTVGVTHLRFDDQGRIVLHQDFWDSAEGFYRHLPVMGALVRNIGRRFNSDEI
jgi:hypothetical protein